MPSVGLIGYNGSLVTVVVSVDNVLNEGPPPGFMDAPLVMQFQGFSFSFNPNIFATSGNVHWTAHPIWVNPTAAGFIVNRKTPSPGNRQFSVCTMAMGYIPAAQAKAKAEMELGADVSQVTSETFWQMKDELNATVIGAVD